MKTGGTMNFLRRAGVILMVVAIFASSCNKYADDFKQLNTKLDALAATVAGVTQLSADNAALKAQITALQTAVSGLPTTGSITGLGTSLTALSGKVDGIVTALANLATAGSATKAIVDGLKTDLAALLKKVTDDNKAMSDKLTALGTTDVAQSQQLTDLIAANNALATQISTAQTSLDNLTTLTGTTATQSAVDALKVQLAAAQATLNQLLANSNMYNGDVTITTDKEMTFWSKKIAQLGMINGNLTINTTAISASKLDSVNLVVKAIGAVIGSQAGVKNSVTITSTSTATKLNVSGLVSVSGNYTVSGVAINDANLSTVGGNFSVNYDGPYAYPNLTGVTGNLTLTRIATSTTKAGTTSISLPTVVVSGSVFDGTNAAGVLVYPEATSIALSGGVTSLTAVVATQITLGSTAYPAPGLAVQASTTAAAVVDLSAATSAAGAVSVNAFNGSTVKFTNLASAAGGVTVNTGTSGTVDFSKLATAAGGITLAGPATIEFPLLASGALTSDATTVTLTKHEMAIAPVLAKVVTLTLGNVNNAVNLDAYNTTLVTASVSGKAQTTWAATTGSVATTSSAKLTTLTLGGNLASASLAGLTKLTSLTTSGNVNSLTVDGASVLTAMTLGHNYYQPGNVANGGPGSNLVITNNPLLTALTPSVLDYPASIVITGNAKLALLDLSSYKTKLLSATGANTTITINSNALVGDYTNAVAITPTTPYAETVIKSTTLASLKAFIASYPATGVPTLTLAINIDKVTLGGVAGNATLSARMSADAAHTMTPGGAPFNFGAPATGITIQKEFTLVQ